MTAQGVSSVGSSASLPVIFTETKKGIFSRELGEFKVCGDASTISYESGWWAKVKNLFWQNVKLSVYTGEGQRIVYIKNSDAQRICSSGEGRLEDLFARALYEKAETVLRSKVFSVSEKRLSSLGAASEEPKPPSSGPVLEVAEGSTEEVRLLFKVFADAGDKGAQYALASMYQKEGGEENLKEAFSLYEKASNQGHLDAKYALARLYERGIGVQKDLEEARTLYAKVLGQGRGDCQADIERVSKEIERQAPAVPSAEPEKRAPAGPQISQKGGETLSVTEGVLSLSEAPQIAQGSPPVIPAPVEQRAESKPQAPPSVFQEPQVEQKIPPVIPAPVEVKKSVAFPSPSPLPEESLAPTGIQGSIAARPKSIPSASGSQDVSQKGLNKKYAQAFRLEQGIGGEKDLQKAFDIYQEAAKEGDVKSQYALISMYLENRGLMQRERWGIQDTKARDALYKEAIGLFKKKSSQDASALYYLGCMKEKGLGGKQNIQSATTLYEMAARGGSVEASRALGSLYERSGNIEKAKEYYEAAMDQGDIHAAFALIPIYRETAGEEEKQHFYEEAFSLFKAKVSDDNDAAYYLGAMSEEGLRGGKNFKNAAFFYQMAAKKGNAKAQYALGSLYERGDGVEQDIEQAEMWYREAAIQDNVDAAGALLSLYARGEGKVQDTEQITKWYQALFYTFTLALPDNDISALYYLGFMSEKGLGVKRDAEGARGFYFLAASRGNAKAQYALASLYERGEGIKQDIEQAEKLYLEAACAGEANAAYALVSLYERGLLTKEEQRSGEYVKALLPISQAIRRAGVDAVTKYYFGIMNEKGLAAKKDIGEALLWYGKAAQDGVVGAKRALGSLYERGEGIKQDIEQAEKLYLEAIDAKDIDAAYALLSLYERELLEKDEVKGEDYTYVHSLIAGPAAKNDAKALYYIGFMHEKGLGVSQEKKNAQFWYKLAEENGSQEAKRALERLSSK